MDLRIQIPHSVGPLLILTVMIIALASTARANPLLQADSTLETIAKELSLGDPKEYDRILGKLKKAATENRDHIPMDDLLPRFVQESIGQRCEVNGPNCYNAAQNFHKPVGKYKFGGITWQDILSKNYEPVQSGGALRYGDIVTVYVTNPRYSHSPRGEKKSRMPSLIRHTTSNTLRYF